MTQTTAPRTNAQPDPTAAPTNDVANAIAAAYKDVLGSGPDKARVHFGPPGTLVVVLENTMTAAERILAAVGEDERLHEHRLVLTAALEQRLRSIVEHALGRRTLAFISGIDARRDVAVAVFTLEPESTAGRNTTSRSPSSHAAAGGR